MDRYLVVGQPVAHSLSPKIHQLFAEQTGDTLSYQTCSAPFDKFESTLDAFFADGGCGVNITLPFKERAYRWVQTCDTFAEEAQAVNTIGQANGESWGANTDGIGLLADLRNNHHLNVRGEHVLLIGAGGAARGVLGPLLKEAPASITIANRTVAKAQLLRDAFAQRYPQTEMKVLVLSELAQRKQPIDLLLNASSAGTKGETMGLPVTVFQGAFCYDMAYGDLAKGATTHFCEQAKDSGARGVSDGLGMLVEQAAAAFHLWRAKMPQTAPVLSILRTQSPHG